jgi:hypothetical protein
MKNSDDKYDKLRLSVLNYFTAQLSNLSDKENLPEDIVEEYRDLVANYGDLGSDEQKKKYRRLSKKIFSKDDPMRKILKSEPGMAMLKAFEINSPLSHHIRNIDETEISDDMIIPQYESIEELLEDAESQGDYTDNNKKIIKLIMSDEIDPEAVQLNDYHGLTKKDTDNVVILPMNSINSLKKDLKHSPVIKKTLIRLLDSYR